MVKILIKDGENINGGGSWSPMNMGSYIGGTHAFEAIPHAALMNAIHGEILYKSNNYLFKLCLHEVQTSKNSVVWFFQIIIIDYEWDPFSCIKISACGQF